MFLGFSDAGAEERSIYDLPDMESELSLLWTQLSPLYKQLFTYVRRRLVQYYGTRRIRPDGPIPAHILGELLDGALHMIHGLAYYRKSSVVSRKHVGAVVEEYHRPGAAVPRETEDRYYR